MVLFMIMLSGSPERIFNPMHYTGCIYDYAHSFFGKNFKLNVLYGYIYDYVHSFFGDDF